MNGWVFVNYSGGSGLSTSRLYVFGMGIFPFSFFLLLFVVGEMGEMGGSIAVSVWLVTDLT